MENTLGLIGRVLFRLSLVAATGWAVLFVALQIGFSLEPSVNFAEWPMFLIIGVSGALAIIVIGIAIKWAFS